MSVYVCTNVPLAPFQERFRQMEASPPEGNGRTQPKDAATRIADRLEWRDRNGHLDSPRVRRVLGLRPDAGYVSHGKRYPPKLRESVTYDIALRLCEAMDLAPYECGL